MIMSSPLSYEAFRATQRFPALDGFRGLCALLVVTAHMTERGVTWDWLSGGFGVTGFFVLSGYLITTLCLREEEDRGGVGLQAFYIRRSFRIFPSYFVMLALYCAVTLLLSRERWPFLAHALPYYLLYCNEFAPPAPFYQSWSLGMEEKYYLIWPVLAFVMCRGRPVLRIGIAAALLILAETVGRLPLLPDYCHPLWKYDAILIGCLLAMGLNSRRGFMMLVNLARPLPAKCLLLAMLGLHLGLSHATFLKPIYPFIVAGFLTSLILGDLPWGRHFGGRLGTYLGRRSYGIYLTHTLVIAPIERILSPVGPWWQWNKVLGMLTAIAVSIGLAEVLYRLIEAPLIRIGHAWSDLLQSRRTGSDRRRAPMPLAHQPI